MFAAPTTPICKSFNIFYVQCSSLNLVYNQTIQCGDGNPLRSWFAQLTFSAGPNFSTNFQVVQSSSKTPLIIMAFRSSITKLFVQFQRDCEIRIWEPGFGSKFREFLHLSSRLNLSDQHALFELDACRHFGFERSDYL